MASPLIPSMWAACAKRSAGARKSPPGAPVSVTRPPLPAGGATRGPPAKGGTGPAADHLFYRRIRVLSLAQCRPHLCASGAHAQGKRYFACQDRAITSEDVVAFLEHL